MNNKINVPENRIIGWNDIINDACDNTGYNLEAPLHHYLIITLDEFSMNLELSTTLLTMSFIKRSDIKSRSDANFMRKLGDECLLLSGLFPDNITRKNLSANYVMGLGKESYNSVANANRKHDYDIQLFSKLSNHFNKLVMTLQQIQKK